MFQAVAPGLQLLNDFRTLLYSQYRGHTLTATITRDGSIEHRGERYDSLSAAGGMARKEHFEGDLAGRPYPPTSGWTFWRIKDP